MHHHHHHQQHHHIAIMELGHLLTHSSLTHPEVSLVVSPGFFCLLGCIFYCPEYMGSHPHLLVVHPVPTNKAMMTESLQYNCCISNGGNGILKHAGPEITGSSPTTGFTLLWACKF